MTIMTGYYVCELCKKETEEVFMVPADEVGAALMKEHLWDKHGVRVP